MTTRVKIGREITVEEANCLLAIGGRENVDFVCTVIPNSYNKTPSILLATRTQFFNKGVIDGALNPWRLYLLSHHEE